MNKEEQAINGLWNMFKKRIQLNNFKMKERLKDYNPSEIHCIAFYDRDQPFTQGLGHAHLETTLIYAHADTELKRKAIEKATSMQNPLNDESAVPQFDVNDDDILKRLYGLK